MEKKTLNICVTGAAGQIGYAFIPLLCSGQVFGPNVKFNLKLLDIPQMEESLKGLILEITDGAYELMQSVESGSDPNQLFKNLDIGIFIGGFPRKQGMERKQLLEQNGKIFVAQGKALEAVANKDCKILVVANPANTNCLILQQNAPKIPKQNFTCLTRLDSNRAHAQIADRIQVPSTDVKNIIIWGNHSSTQYPDVNHGNVYGIPIRDMIQDDHYLNNEFITRVQKRGAEILEAKKSSSVLSAANAAKDHLRDWFLGAPSNQFVSMGVYSNGQLYDVPEGIIYSFPIKCKGNFKYDIVEKLTIDEFSKDKMNITAKELLDEKAEAFGS